jgi:hypothetical protein
MLVPLTREQLATLRHWFRPERPGPLVAQHVLATGNGTCLADRWPDPRALVVQTGGNYTVPDCISVCQSALTGGTERSCVTWSPRAPCSGSRV